MKQQMLTMAEMSDHLDAEWDALAADPVGDGVELPDWIVPVSWLAFLSLSAGFWIGFVAFVTALASS